MVKMPDVFRGKSGITAIDEFLAAEFTEYFFSNGFREVCSLALPGNVENASGILVPFALT